MEMKNEIDADLISKTDLRLLEMLIANTDEMIVITDANLNDGPRITYINDAVTKIAGYTPDEMIGQTPRIFQGPNTDRMELDRLRESLEQGKHFKGQLINYHKNGDEYWVELSVFPMWEQPGQISHFAAIQREITNLKQVEQQIADYSERLSALLGTVVDGVITINNQGIVQTFNPAAVEIFGYEPREVIGQNVKMLMPEPYHEEHDSYIGNYLESGEGKVIGIGREVKAQRKDGSVFPMELGIGRMSTKSGEETFVGTIRDISDRKQAEQATRDSEAKIKAIVDNTVDGLITIDEYGNIETFNKACEAIFGYKTIEVIGQNVKILMPEPYHGEHDGYLKNYHNTGKKKIIGIGREVQGKRKDGAVFPIDLSISEIKVQGRKLYSGIVRDISDRKEAEEALKESEARMRAIVNHTAEGLMTIDEYGTVETFNKACQVIFGFDPQEVIGQNVKMLMPDPYYSEHDQYLKNYHKTSERKIIGVDREVHGKHKDGHTFPVDLSVSEMRVRGKKLYSGIVRDITERKSAEDEIMRSNEELERFAYITSHDLQEPLRMVVNFTGLLEAEYKDKSLDDQALEYMNFITDSACRMQGMVSDLLEYSRIEHNEGNLTDVDCKTHVELALNNLKEAIDETDSEIIVGDLPVIKTNPVLFTSLLQNLIGNAIKYRSPERIPRIEIIAEDKNSEWLFSVKDNGIGIKNEYLEQIFILLKRLHSKNEYQGTGIGLTICKKIVENYGGTIWAESEYGIGTIFYFTLPKEETERKAA